MEFLFQRRECHRVKCVGPISMHLFIPGCPMERNRWHIRGLGFLSEEAIRINHNRLLQDLHNLQIYFRFHRRRQRIARPIQWCQHLVVQNTKVLWRRRWVPSCTTTSRAAPWTSNRRRWQINNVKVVNMKGPPPACLMVTLKARTALRMATVFTGLRIRPRLSRIWWHRTRNHPTNLATSREPAPVRPSQPLLFYFGFFQVSFIFIFIYT